VYCTAPITAACNLLHRIMSNREILFSLRQVQFPDCVRVALDHLAYVSSHKSSSISTTVPSYQVEAVNDQIVSEFVLFLHMKKVSICLRVLELSLNSGCPLNITNPQPLIQSQDLGFGLDKCRDFQD